MKSLLNKLLLLTISSLMLWSCTKDDTLVKVGTGTAAALNTSVSSVVLTKPNIANTAITFTFSPASFGYDAAVTNTLQIARTGTSFASPKEFTLDPGVTTKSFTVLDFNALLLSMNLTPGTASQIDVRLKSSISTAVNPVYSNVKSVSVTPFALIEYLYMPGAYQGWNPTSADSLTSETGNGIYKGTIQFNASTSEFKLLKKKSWGAPEYGRGSAEAGGTPSALISVGGQNLVGPTTNAPYARDNFEVVADLNANTIAYTLNSWGIIGSATAFGWGDDTVMKYNNTTKKWTITASLSAGEFKFRKNHNWGTNLGGSGGTLNDGGNNIPIASAGTYTITLDPVAKTYTITQ
jgi:hypothetical protein